MADFTSFFITTLNYFGCGEKYQVVVNGNKILGLVLVNNANFLYLGAVNDGKFLYETDKYMELKHILEIQYLLDI